MLKITFVIKKKIVIFALTMPQEQSQIRERQRIDLREPPRYKVTIHNDDFTPMDFVVKILTQVFFKQPAEAERLPLWASIPTTSQYRKYRRPPAWHVARDSP